MNGSEKQIEYATNLLASFASRLLDHGLAGECQTTITEDANSRAFLATLTDDAHLIIEAFSGRVDGFKIDISDIRDFGADVWGEIAAMAAKRPNAYRNTMAIRK